MAAGTVVTVKVTVSAGEAITASTWLVLSVEVEVVRVLVALPSVPLKTGEGLTLPPPLVTVKEILLLSTLFP